MEEPASELQAGDGRSDVGHGDEDGGVHVLIFGPALALATFVAALVATLAFAAVVVLAQGLVAVQLAVAFAANGAEMTKAVRADLRAAAVVPEGAAVFIAQPGGL